MKSSMMQRIKLSLKLKTLVKEDMDDFASESSSALEAVKSGQNANVTLEATQQELKNINYLQQGDADYYTEEAIKLRHSIRGDHRVVDQIAKFWRFIPKEDKDFDPTLGGLTPRQSVEVHIVKRVYSATVVLLQLILLPKFGMTGDMNYDPDEDWLDDNKGLDIMAYPNFFDAMFELADMWCESVSADSYAGLLEKLYADFVEKHDVFRDLLRRFGYIVPPWWPGDPCGDAAAANPPPSPPMIKSLTAAAPFQEPRAASARSSRAPPPLQLTPPERRPINVTSPSSSYTTSIKFDEPDMARSPKWYQTYMRQVFEKHRTGADGGLETISTREGSCTSKSFSSGQVRRSVRVTEVLPPNQLHMDSEANQTYVLVDFSPKASRRGSSGRGGGPPSIFSNSPSAAAVSQARRFFGGIPSPLDELTVVPRSESLPLISRLTQGDLAEASAAPNTSRTPSFRPQPPPPGNLAAGSGRAWIWKPADLPSMRPQTASIGSVRDQRPGSSGSPLRHGSTGGGGGRQQVVLLQTRPGSPAAGGNLRSPCKDSLVAMPQVSPLLVIAPDSPSGFKGSTKLKGSTRPQ